MLKFFRVPFALSGTRTPVPDAADPSGYVSFIEGYGADYQRAKTDPLSKNIERDKMNGLFFDMTNAVAELQAQGTPDFITTALNGGSPYSYARNAVVRWTDGNLYVSLAGGNTAAPSDATKWVRYDLILGFDGVGAIDVLDQNKPMANYTALRAYSGRALGVRITQQGLAGFFARSLTDTTSADNGGTIIVDAAGRRWIRLYAGQVNVKWFGAVGDGVADDLGPIQAAINVVTNTTFATTWPGGVKSYAKGGGGVLLPPGRYRVTDSILLGQHVSFRGISTTGYLYPDGAGVTGSEIISDFADPNKWIIDTANYDAAGNRIGYRSNTSGAAMDAGNYNFTHGVEVRDLYITRKTGTSAYGGVRLCGSPNSKISNINVNGADIGYLINASWGVSASELQSQTYLYGFVALADVNGISIEGYFDEIDGKTVDASNRLIGLLAADFNATVGLPDWANKKFGLLCYYTSAVVTQRVITEGWEVARAFVQSKGVCENGPYVERNSEALVGVVSSNVVFNGMFQFNPPITVGYYFGFNADVVLNGMPPSGFGGVPNGFTEVKIAQNQPDKLGWKYSDVVSYLGAKTGIIRVSSGGSASNIAYDTSYTTIDEALRRIENSNTERWVIEIVAGQTVTIGAVHALDGKQVTIRSDTPGSNANLVFGLTAGVPYYLSLQGNVGLKFQDINLSVAAGSSSDAFLRGMLFIAQGNAGNIEAAFKSCVVDLQSSFALFQQGFQTTSSITAAFQGCTINGSASAVVMAGASTNSAATNVISRQFNSTTAASVKAFGTNGWVNANVLSSNF